MHAIEVRELYKSFEATQALKGLTFTVPEGIIFGLIGADGAGKTTLMRLLATLIKADKGSASVLGFDIVQQLHAIRSHIGYMPQRFSLYQDLSVKENLSFFADVFGIQGKDRKEKMNRLLSFSKLDPFVNRRAAHLSGGMKQKLALSCALIHTPKLLLLDEPTTGVDPVSRKEFWDILAELKQSGITIIISTPYMDEATLCDKLLFIHQGQTIESGAPSELLKKYPYELYKVSSIEGTISCSASAKLKPELKLLYPSGGALKAAVADKNLPMEKVFASVKLVAQNADTIEKCAPTIEDLLFYLLSKQESMA